MDGPQVARSRGKQKHEQTPADSLAYLDRSAVEPGLRIRGRCSLCRLDVFDSQPRLKDYSLHQHEDCWGSNREGLGATVNAAAIARTDARQQADPAFAHAQPDVGMRTAIAEPTGAAPRFASTNIRDQTLIEANAQALAVAAETQTEVAAILAAADAARAQAKHHAEAALALAQADALQFNAAVARAAPAQHTTEFSVTGSEAVSASTRSPFTKNVQPHPGFTTRQPMLPVAPKIKPLLPDGKHVFLSYQWGVQAQVKEIKAHLNTRNVKCWMDIDGGMKSDIYDSMAEGVQGAACVVCFMTNAYQDSANCKLELKFAQQSGVPIIPVMMEPNFSAKGWLGILTSGSIWTPMYDNSSVSDGIDKLITQAQHLIPGMRGEYDAGDTLSETSGDGSSFDVGRWGDAMFSLAEVREELERLRKEHAPSGGERLVANEPELLLCMLPAMVPTLPRGLLVTAAMQSVLGAVLSNATPPQIGFCGMGGIGKTTFSSWVTRSDAVRTKFGMVAWVTLGQAPVLGPCLDLLHQQLAGTVMPSGISAEQKHLILQQAFLEKSVLLILDDCWDAGVVKHFNWIDQSTNSKVLISSRVRGVLDGGQIIDVAVPSKADAVNMLLSTAGMDVDALKEHTEVARVAELCKRLPLTIGVAGKLIRQLAHGSKMTEASEWTDVVALLEEELKDPFGSMSVEASVIRVSIKAIPKKIRANVVRLFYAFALIPEDTPVPLPVLGMIFDACGNPTPAHGTATGKTTVSRLQARRYLKILIDRSLVLGTVDRPQLHDVMLDFVKTQLAGDAQRAAQRRLVESLRESDRARGTPTGKYIQHNVRHHIKESYDASWQSSTQAISWIEDHVSGVQGVVATSTASILPAEALAKEAEDAGMWWQAALRWNALGLLQLAETGNQKESVGCIKLAVDASAKAGALLSQSSNEDGSVNSLTQFELDTFDICALRLIFKSWDPADKAVYGTCPAKFVMHSSLHTTLHHALVMLLTSLHNLHYVTSTGERYSLVCDTDAGRDRPTVRFGAIQALEWYPLLASADKQQTAVISWKISKMILDLCDQTTDAFARSTAEERNALKNAMACFFFFSGDAIISAPGFSFDYLNNGDKFIEHYFCYKYEENHHINVELHSNDVHVYAPGAGVLTLQHGRVEDAKRILDDHLTEFEKVAINPAGAGYGLTMAFALCNIPQVHHILGLSKHAQRFFDLANVTFDNADAALDTLTKPLQGGLFTTLEQRGGRGVQVSLKRCIWQTKAMCILNLNVPEPTARAWLKSLPDNETVCAYSLTLPAEDGDLFDQGASFMYQACWIALAHEKLGLYEGAIRFADLQLEQDLRKGGAPFCHWPQTIALACKGRVFAKLNQHAEALVAFEAAIVESKHSYSLMAAFALRELANYVADGGGDTVTVVHAGKDLQLKLDTFKGRMTTAEFDGLTIAP